MARGRRVRRVLRKIDTWSLAKMAFLLHLCFALVFLVAGTTLWFGADGSGAISKLEDAVKANLRLDTFSIDGSVLFRAALAGTLLFAFMGTVLTVLAGFLFNMLSDLTGGIQVWVLEEVLFDQDTDEEVEVTDDAAETGERAPEPAGEPIAVG